MIVRIRFAKAEIEDSVVDFSAVIPAIRGSGDADVVELDGLFVEPDQMRAGVGRKLVVDATQVAWRGGAARGAWR